MKVILLYPPYSEGNTSEYGMTPLGLLYIATYLKNKNIDVKIIDAQMEGLTLEQIRQRVLIEDPDFLGITVLTQMFTIAVKIAKEIKLSNQNIKIVFGGCHINSTLNETFQYTNAVDYLIYGEGEETFYELLKGNFTDGLITKDRVYPPREFLNNLDKLPFLDYELIENFNINRWKVPFADRKPVISMIATRGCPYQCTFCDIHKTNGRTLRLRSINNLIDEIQGLILRYEIKYIIFKDSTFVINRKWVIDFCDELIKRDVDIHWRCNARVDLIDEVLLDIMKKAGCHNISFGVESGSQRILDLLKKQTTIEQIKNCFKLTNKLDIETHASFIIGSPTETKEEAEQTIKLAKEINPTFAQFGKGVAYPNTEYFEQGRKLNLIDNKWYLKTQKAYSESYLVDPNIGGEFKVDFNSEEIIKKAHKEFYLRFAYIKIAIKKIIKQPSFAVDLMKSGLMIIGWVKSK